MVACFCCSALGYIVGSGVSSLVHSFFKQSDSWRWALRVSYIILNPPSLNPTLVQAVGMRSAVVCTLNYNYCKNSVCFTQVLIASRV